MDMTPKGEDVIYSWDSYQELVMFPGSTLFGAKVRGSSPFLEGGVPARLAGRGRDPEAARSRGRVLAPPLPPAPSRASAAPGSPSIPGGLRPARRLPGARRPLV